MVGIALIVSWFVAVVFAPLLGVLILKPPKPKAGAEPGKVLGLYQRLPDGCHAGEMDDHRR